MIRGLDMSKERIKLEILKILYDTDLLTITEISEKLEKIHIKNSGVSEIIQLIVEMENKELIEQARFYEDTDESQYSIEEKGVDLIREYILKSSG